MVLGLGGFGPRGPWRQLARRCRGLSIGGPDPVCAREPERIYGVSPCSEFSVGDPKLAGGEEQVKQRGARGRRHEASQGGCPRA